MANSKDSDFVLFNELVEADVTLTTVKSCASTCGFNLSNIAIASDPKSNSLHFIKSIAYWKSFIEICEKKKLENLYLIIHPSITELVNSHEKIIVCYSTPNVEMSMVKISKLLFDKKFANIASCLDGRVSGTVDIHPTALVSPLAFIGENVKIEEDVEVMPGAHISAHCQIGAGSKIFPKSCLYPFVILGKKCRVHSGTIIGADGFGYVFENGIHHKLWHIGGVVIKDNVEIGANCCIDAGTFLPTLIEEGCIIDNLVQVGHNTHLGKGVVLCGQSGTGGSSKAGNFSVFGGRSALGPQCELGKFSKVAGGALVNKSWGDSSELGGYPARPLKEWLKGLAKLKQLVQEDKKNDL